MKKFAKLLSGFVSAALAVNFAAPAVSVVLADTDNTIASLSETIKAGLQRYDAAIDVSSFGLKVDNEENKAESVKRITDSISYVRKLPDMFSVQYETSLSIQIGYGADGAYIIKDIVIRYTNTKEEADARLAEVNEKIDEIIAKNITPEMTELEKALNLHDYLVLNTSYDLNQSVPDLYDGYTAYDILMCGNGVCEGYAQAYNMLLEKAGISSIMVTSDSMNHAWNLVNIDGEWYHVDVTWDDPTPDAKGRVGHGYFLLSDKAFAQAKPEAGRNTAHRDWNSKGFEAKSEKYDNAFWQTVSAEIFTRGDQWYFINKNGEYSRYNESTGNVDTWISLCEEKWYTWDDKNNMPSYKAYWDGKYMSLIISDNKVYFNTPTQLYSMNLDGSEKVAVGNYINPYETHGLVYGLKLNDGKIYAVIKQKPDDEGSLYEIIAIADAGINVTHKVSFIESLVDMINAMPDGTTGKFDFNEETVLPSEAIDAMRDRDITITFDLGEYSWDIKGKDIGAEETGDLNLEIKKDQGVIPGDMLKSVSRNNSSVIELDLQHEGLFGLKASINYLLGSEFCNNIAVLYTYNQAESKMDKMNTTLVDSNGSLQLSLEQSSCYALVLNNAYAPIGTETSALETTASETISETEPAVTETEVPTVTTAPEVTTVPETTTVSETVMTTEQTTVSETTAPEETTVPETTTAATEPATETSSEATTTEATTPAVTTAATEQTTPAETTPVTEKPEPEGIKGDIDGNGRIDLSDLTTVALYLLGDVNLNETQLKFADVDGDGIVGLTDLARIKQFISHKIEKL